MVLQVFQCLQGRTGLGTNLREVTSTKQNTLAFNKHLFELEHITSTVHPSLVSLKAEDAGSAFNDSTMTHNTLDCAFTDGNEFRRPVLMTTLGYGSDQRN